MNVVATLGAALGRNRGLGQENEIDTLVAPQTFDWQAGIAKNDRAWLVDKPGRTRALTSSRTLAVFGGNDTSGERSGNASLTAHPTGRYDFESENLIAATLNSGGNNGGFRTEPGERLVVGALSAHSKAHGHAMTTQQAAESGHVIAFTERTRTEGRTFEAQEDLAYALTNPGSGGRTHSRQIAGCFGVRRLTPVECERLQGFEDGWTAWGVDESGQRVEMSDSARYRMIGNAVCRAVSDWLDRRILAVVGAAGG